MNFFVFLLNKTALFVFLLVNATLFIRPTEFAPDLMGWPIYEGLIVVCLIQAAPRVLEQLTAEGLAGRPVSACRLAMLPAIVLSHIFRLRLETAFDQGLEFFKVLLYYLLLVGLVDDTAKLRRFLRSLVYFASVITLLSVLQYHGVIKFEAIRFIETIMYDEFENITVLRRLGSTGLFQDPNDMCLMLVGMMLVCLYEIVERRRWLFAAPLALLGHALTLTGSRGGFLALLVGMTVTLMARFGKLAVPVGMVVLPVLFVAFAGRQTTIEVGGGTGQTRIQLWSEGLGMFLRSPVVGVGSGTYEDHAGQVAHNSFIHCYAELGFLGGTCFLGAFYAAIVGLKNLDPMWLESFDRDLWRLRPYVLGMVAGYVGGIMTLSCSYIIPTYTVLGVAAVVLRIAGRDPCQTVPRVDARFRRRLSAVSVAFLIIAYVYVRTFGRFG